ncbi:MAG: FkbM family methyltransferase [Rhodospirillaceae bacterium]|nr:FkbM family methyltransferase [Rhodospirillaceae bacterium]MCY4066134.1 FkbM family methyltransferase [Rhodospirillaceae bacterium]
MFRKLWKWRWIQPLLVRHWPAVEMKIGSHAWSLGMWNNFTERRMYMTGKADSIASVSRLTALVAGRRSLVFDIGANIGAFTVPLAACAGRGSTILAFEPIPELADRCRGNLRLNGLDGAAAVVEVALGREAGEMDLCLNVRNLGGSSLRPGPAGRSIPVAVRPLLDYLPDDRADYRTFVVKADVEGYEDEILIPFLSALPQDRVPDAVMIEATHKGRWREDLCGYLEERGYEPFFVGEEGNTLFLKPA